MTLDVIFACNFFSDVILNVILYHAWRESALAQALDLDIVAESQ